MSIVNRNYLYRIFVSNNDVKKEPVSLIYQNALIKDKPCFYVGIRNHGAIKYACDFIPDFFLEQIKNKNHYLMIGCEYEAFADLIEEIYVELVINQNIPETNIIYVTGTPDVLEDALSISAKYQKGLISVYWFSSIEEYSYQFTKNKIASSENKKSKKFICLNRRWRPHRPLLITKLFERNLLEDGYISLGKSDDNINWHNIYDRLLDIAKTYNSDKTTQLLTSIKNKILEIPELYLDTENLAANDFWFSEKLLYYYNTSYFSVVTETNFFEKERYLTEKTFRAVVFKHPFILLSPTNSLELLRSLGYKTFHPYINEDYDKEKDPFLRMDLVVDEIERLCNMSESELQELQKNVQPILEHNYKVLESKNQISEYLKKIV